MIESLMPKIQIVVLRNPITTWDEPQTRDLFCQAVSLKLKGYGREYPEGVIAIDAIDFIADHLLFCEQRSNGSLRVIMGYKSVPHSRCEHYHLPFPAFPLLKSSNAEKYVSKIENLITDARKKGEELAYSASWTVDDHTQRNRELNRYLRKLFTTMIIGYHRDYNIPQWMACGVLRFRTDEYFQTLGGVSVTDVVPQFSLEGEPVKMFHIPKHTKEALTAAAELDSVWQQRLVIEPQIAEKVAQVLPFKKAA